MCRFIFRLSILFHWSVCLFLVPIPSCFDYCSFVVLSPPLFFFFRISLAIWSHLWVHINCRIVLDLQKKNVIGNLIGIGLNLQIALGSMAILIKLILPNQEDGTCFHFFESSSISFINVFFLSAYRSSTPWLALFLIIFYVLLKWIFKNIFCYFTVPI